MSKNIAILLLIVLLGLSASGFAEEKAIQSGEESQSDDEEVAVESADSSEENDSDEDSDDSDDSSEEQIEDNSDDSSEEEKSEDDDEDVNDEDAEEQAIEDEENENRRRIIKKVKFIRRRPIRRRPIRRRRRRRYRFCRGIRRYAFRLRRQLKTCRRALKAVKPVKCPPVPTIKPPVKPSVKPSVTPLVKPEATFSKTFLEASMKEYLKAWKWEVQERKAVPEGVSKEGEAMKPAVIFDLFKFDEKALAAAKTPQDLLALQLSNLNTWFDGKFLPFMEARMKHINHLAEQKRKKEEAAALAAARGMPPPRTVEKGWGAWWSSAWF
eukprot:TRINITY_DN4803_c0_g1_i2.p1 TRINITY_DN4803_c0_g1~~TRINITY_DN4803_c0_g1_i2.p1  ORF type:complete len:360 (-),score=118.54 TRINITY_DN4803_c0_g1_i2:41-1015(-)